MTDETTTLRDVLDAYEPVSFAEHQTIEPAQIFVRPGIDPVDILDDLERKRETVDDWTTLEHDQGIAEVWMRYGRELIEWIEVATRLDPAEKREWILGHPIFASLGCFLDAEQIEAEMGR